MIFKGDLMEKILDVENVSISFIQYTHGLKQQNLNVITDLTLDLNKGELLAILGSSGSGKSLITLKEGTKIKVLAVTEKPLLPQEKTLLEKMLSAIQLTNLENCYITSLLKCIPVFSPSFSEFEGCMRFFETELHAIKPSFILSLGNFTSSLIIRSPKNSNFQGKFIDLNGTPLLTTFSPSEILKNSSLKRPAWEDLKVLKSKIEAL